MPDNTLNGDRAAVGDPHAAPFVAGAVEPLPGRAPILRATAGIGELSAAQRVNLWTATAQSYEPLWRRWSIALLTLGGWSTDRELETLIGWTAAQPGDLILDAGCSAGLYARTLLAAEPAATVHAVDVSAPFLREAWRRRGGDRPNLVLVQADVQRLPYLDASFDTVVCGGSLNEFQDPAGALKEFARVLRPGGLLFLMYPTQAGSGGGRLVQKALVASGLHFPAPEQVAAWSDDAGFRLKRRVEHPPIEVALYRVDSSTTGGPANPR